jgi:hypothetical protein
MEGWRILHEQATLNAKGDRGLDCES